MTLKRTAWTLAFAAALVACEKTPTTNGNAEAPATKKSSRSLVEQGKSVVSKIRELETKKDVTCWVSFRQLDMFIATKEYSDFASLAKIASQKAMVLAVWDRASNQAKGPEVSPEDVRAAIKLRDVVIPDEQRRELKSFATDLGMKDFEDYRKTGEHYRVLLAVTTDAIYNNADLKPLTPEAEDAMADVVMQLSLELLKESGKIATNYRSPFIEADHVKEAHRSIAKAYDLDQVAWDNKPLAPQEVQEKLFPITKALLDAKVGALKHFNKEDPRTPYKAKDTLDAINRVIPKPITADALDKLLLDLRSFTRFAAGGLEPMRSDNYLSDGSFAPAKLPRNLYPDAIWMHNVSAQIFPYHQMTNGDVKLRLEPNPATIAPKDREPRDVLLLDHEQNAIRDSAIHWEILQTEFEQRPFALEPFAAELLSELNSIVLTHYLYEAARIADEAGKDTIDLEAASKVRDPTYVMTTPHHQEARKWTEADEARKAKALEGYRAPLFKDLTAASGLPTSLKLDSVGEDVVRADIQRVMGSGIAVGDANGDGAWDLFLAGEGLARLYLAKSGESAKFEDATTAWGLPEGMFDSRGALFLDYDGDGDDDLFVVRSAHPSALFRNEGGKFVEVKDSGIRTGNGAHSVAAFDYDANGQLDLYIGYYGSADVNSGKSNARNLPAIDGRNGTPNQLWKQQNGKFTEVAAAAGVADEGWTLAVAAFDFDVDGDQDLYLANDFGRNAFFRNEGNGKFADIGTETHTADRGSGMNVSFTDVDADGLPDWYVTNIDMFSKNIKVIFPTEETTVNVDDSLQKAFQYIAGNKLYLTRKGDEGYAFESAELERFEPGDRGWGWDANFFDYDLDGDEDLYLSNGWIEGSYAEDQKNQMFVNDGGFFFVAPPDSPEAFAGNSRSVAAGDLDGDGDADLVVNNFRQPPRVFLNEQANGNGFAKVRLRGQRAGAIVTLTAGGKSQKRWMTVGRGYLSQDPPEALFGLGDAREFEVEVLWPNGSRSRGKGKAGETIELSAGKT